MSPPRDTDRDWERLARTDPYFAVVTDPRFRRETLSREDLAKFFDSGRSHVEELIGDIRLHLDPGFSPDRALDFGCGVGRTLAPLAEIAREVVGADVSESMIREAASHVESLGNVRLVTIDDSLEGLDGSFDFIHSFIVLQHVPPPRGLSLFRRLADRLRSGGVGAIHVMFGARHGRKTRLWRTARRWVPGAESAWNWKTGRGLRAPPIQMNEIPIREILSAIQDRGCSGTWLRFTEHFGYRGVLALFRRA